MVTTNIKHHTHSALIIDDEVDLNDIIKELLNETCYFKFVIQAKDGSEAWQKLTKQKFDVVILDMLMPKKSGIEFLEMWSKESSYDPRRIIVYSGNLDDTKIRIASKQYQVKNFMVKPFDEDDFAKKVEAILALKPLEAKKM